MKEESVLIISTQKIICEYWSQKLTQANYETVCCWTTASDALRLIDQHQSDFLLIEAAFAENTGFDVARQAVLMLPSLR